MNRRGLGITALILFGFGVIFFATSIAPPPAYHQCSDAKDCYGAPNGALNNCANLRQSNSSDAQQYAPDCFGQGHPEAFWLGIVAMVAAAFFGVLWYRHVKPMHVPEPILPRARRLEIEWAIPPVIAPPPKPELSPHDEAKRQGEAITAHGGRIATSTPACPEHGQMCRGDFCCCRDKHPVKP